MFIYPFYDDRYHIMFMLYVSILGDQPSRIVIALALTLNVM